MEMERVFTNLSYEEGFTPQYESEARGNPLFKIEDSHPTTFIGLFSALPNKAIHVDSTSSHSKCDHVSPRAPTLSLHED